MIENPNLTRRILEYFASDDVKFPANKRVEELKAEAFPEVDLSCLKYHVKCAEENGLLTVTITEQATQQHVYFIFGYISGLRRHRKVCIQNSARPRNPTTRLQRAALAIL